MEFKLFLPRHPKVNIFYRKTSVVMIDKDMSTSLTAFDVAEAVIYHLSIFGISDSV